MTEQTRRWLEAYDPSPLMDGQQFWGQSQDDWLWNSGRMRTEIEAASTNGTWAGIGQASALALALRDEAQSKEMAAIVLAAQSTARVGAGELNVMRSVAQSAIMAAEDPDPVQGNFTVTNGLGLRDNMTSYPGGSAQRAARQAMAEFHSERINAAVTALRDHHEVVVGAMRTHAGNLRDNGLGATPPAHMTDFKTGGGDKGNDDDDNGDSWFLGPAGALPGQVQHNLGSGDKPAKLPDDWGKPEPPPPPPQCSEGQFVDKLKKATEHTAIEAGGLVVLPEEGPFLPVGIVGLIVNGDNIADDMSGMWDCMVEGHG